MKKAENQSDFIHQLKVRFTKEMPRIRKEIQLYEKKKRNNQLTLNPKIAPQFSGQ